jgi:N-acetylmuramoyl-L-alanine amidase
MNKKQEDNTTSEFQIEGDQGQDEIVQNEGYSIFRGIQSVISVAILVATLLTLWNPRKVFTTPRFYDLFQSVSSMETASDIKSDSAIQTKVGILAGHWQDNPGEVCADGIIEADVNHAIAEKVKLNLEEKDIAVKLFNEFDLDYLNYEAKVFLGIYSGSCLETPLPPSGFKIGTSLTAGNSDLINAFAVCLAENYQTYTGLPFTYEVVNPDHSSYHIFRDINPNTPAALIMIGALSTDRDLIINRSNTVAEGIAAGITCFIEKSS